MRIRPKRLFLVLFLLLLAASHVHRRVNPAQRPPSTGQHYMALKDAEGKAVQVACFDHQPDKPNAPVLVLLHGSPFPAGHSFDAIVPHFAGHCRLIIPDLPGFGASTLRLPDYSIRAHAEYLEQMLDQLQIRNAHLVGYSMGGGPAIHLAATRPDLWSVPAKGGDVYAVLTGAHSIVNPSFDQHAETLVYEHRRYDTDIWRFQLDPGPGDENPSIAAASTRWELYPALSSSGLRMAHASDRSGSYEIWVSDLDGTSARRLTQFMGPLTSYPSWSPDDRLIAFDARPDGHADIFVIDPESGHQSRLTEHPADDVSPSWSADGNWVYFGSNRGGSWQVWRTSPDTATTEQVTRNGGMRAMESSRGLYFTRPGEPGLWHLDGEVERQVLEHPAPVDWGNWHAGEQGIYVIDRGSARPSVVLYPSDQSEPLQIFESPHMIPMSDSALGVSRDGQVILFGGIVERWVDLVMVTGPRL